MTPPSARTRYLLRPVASSRDVVGALRGPVLVYGALSLVAIGAAVARARSPISVPPAESWLPLPDAFGRMVGHGSSLLGGAGLAILTIKATRHFVRRWGWARALHSDLRPAIRNAGDGTILILGIASALGEELFFRGLLTTTFGVIASSLAFGLLHQMRGRVRWVWAGWATVMGFLFSALFLATGSLLGPLVAHAAINVTNLRFLRDTDVEAPTRRHLGGLLGRT
jgi:membrane protease YdiL (CAAX protease family)